MTIPELFLRDAARDAAVRVYDEAEATQRDLADAHRASGKPLTARIHSQRAYIAHRAAVAEHTNPPERVAWTLVCCPGCALYRQLPADMKEPQE